MNQSFNIEDINFFKQAADHLRAMAKSQFKIQLGSGHAHNLVAATLGHKSAAAAKEKRDFSLDDPWLGQNAADVTRIQDTISRMKEPTVCSAQAAVIGEIVRDGLTPACTRCGILQSTNFPLGAVDVGDTSDIYEWLCVTCLNCDDQFGECRLCGSTFTFRLEDLDENGLCEEHSGEFDMDPDEEDDMNSYVAYWQDH